MDRELLKELLTSPLERPRRGSRRTTGAVPETGGITPEGQGSRGERPDPLRVPLLWALGAMVLGATIVLMGYSIAADETPPTTTGATTTTTTAVAASDGSPGDLPADYVAAGDRLGMRVERILARPDGIFVTVTTVLVNSLDPDVTTGFQGGLWTLVMSDGRRITSTAESFDALARGTVSIWFPPEGVVPQDIASLELNGFATRTTNVLSAETTGTSVLSGDGTPVTLPLSPARFEIDAGVGLVMESVALTATDARVEWELTGETLANASVAPFSLTVLKDGVGDETLIGSFQSSGFAFFHSSLPGDLLDRSGVMGYTLQGGGSLPTDVEIGAGIEFQVTWAVYEPAVVVLPVEGVPIAEVTG